MDVSAAASKIANIMITVNEYVEKIKSIYNKYAEKINSYIDELDRIIEKMVELGSQAIVWVEMQIKKVLKKISDALDSVKTKINDIINQLKDWYEKTIKKIKISIIKGSMAKLGVSLTDSAAEAMSDMIPNPDITSLIPEIKIELQLPDTNLSASVELDMSKYRLKKLPLL